jgi:HrpA-like RNA helicase
LQLNAVDVKLGEEVGYRFRGAPRLDASKTMLVYTTDACAPCQSRGDPSLREYAGIIIGRHTSVPHPWTFSC